MLSFKHLPTHADSHRVQPGLIAYSLIKLSCIWVLMRSISIGDQSILHACWSSDYMCGSHQRISQRA